MGDPKFVNPTGADFHLQSGSPAIDAGSPLNAPDSDFDGNARPRGAGYSIGAYEY
ncbi:MAG: choice-of-anchor Q domain-containing protein [Anaerolineales bacterium]